MDKSGQECQENFERVNRTMENIGQSIQQSVGLLAETFRWKTQQSFYFNSNMLPSPKGFHYQIVRFKILIKIMKSCQKMLAMHSTNFSFIKLQEC